jgi:hypothetical protein
MSYINERVGQQNSIKVIASISGAAGGFAALSENVIGGIASVTSLNVSGVSTFVGVATFKNNVFIDGNINVVGGVTSVTSLNVSGVSTFVGIATFKNDVYIDGDLYISDDLVFDEFTVRNGNITGILTVAQSFYYPQAGQPYGIAYFNPNDLLVSTGSTSEAISETNYILTTDESGVPTWSDVIDGGTY